MFYDKNHFVRVIKKRGISFKTLLLFFILGEVVGRSKLLDQEIHA